MAAAVAAVAEVAEVAEVAAAEEGGSEVVPSRVSSPTIRRRIRRAAEPYCLRILRH